MFCADIVLARPDDGVALYWRFALETPWPATGCAFKGGATLTLEVPQTPTLEVPQTPTDVRRLLVGMRDAYQTGRAFVTATTAPVALDEDARHAIVLTLFDHHIRLLALDAVRFIVS